ncbi:hypothetical protein HMI54_013606, partial [Coelomomyces lativittatus]
YGQQVNKMALEFPGSVPAGKWVNYDQAIASERPDTIYYLDLRKRKLKRIPKEVYTFKNLKALNLAQNNIRRIPAKLNRLDSLQILNLSENGMGKLNEEVAVLRENLKAMSFNRDTQESADVLYAQIQQKMTVPVNLKVKFGKNTTIQELNLSGSNLTKLHKS